MTEINTTEIQTQAIEDPFEANIALGKAFQKDKDELQLKPFSRLVVSTSSSQKQRIIAEIGEKLGITVQPTLLPLDSEREKRIGKGNAYLIRKRVEDPTLYSFDLVKSKLMVMPVENNPILTTDTTVINVNNQVIEKPKDIEEAKRIIDSLLGSRIKIVTAIGLLAENSDRKPLIIREGVEILLKIKKLSDKEIKKYIKNNKDRLLQVAGGIDFATVGNEFIDESVPIIVRAIDFRDKVLGESTLGKQEIKLTKSALESIQTYFLGAPEHPIKSMLSQSIY